MVDVTIKKVDGTLASTSSQCKWNQPRKRKLSPKKVKLLPTSNMYINRQAPRKAGHAATKKKNNAAFHLMYNILGHVFSIEEMAQSRGTGLGRPKPGEKDKPLLDGEKIATLKEYVNSWYKKNKGYTFPDKKLNSSVTERTAYARKQLRKFTI